ncbi:Doubled CXXCH motif protein [Rubripirellula obstinata]|uniref:Doubled CXXCH motif protein n=1 Tax=Rubripirellula obstinata TaxID=406547 RepID=A0A5B1CBA3_9BACT|nr:cytochrome c3 family protein [Rubripirellula obstinata]KAA1258448.1 Doubled CXXCH motif protein [Rubripirellula obstinata]
MPRIANLIFAGILCVIASMIVAAVLQSGFRADSHTGRADASQFIQEGIETQRNLRLAAEGTESQETPFPVIVRKPIGPPRIELAGTDPQGRTGSVACSTCHSVRKPNLENKTVATLDEFHQGMEFSHGKVACYACHNPKDSDSLRLADGTSVAYQDVMTMCAQCHSKQAESFANGAHGGMNGHWDLSRGPQMKNNCIDCHDPHAPSYPKMIVGFKPKDRFNAPVEDHHDEKLEVKK